MIEISAYRVIGLLEPVMTTTAAPRSFTVRPTSINERVDPVLEMATTASSGFSIEAAISCWCESWCAMQGTPNRGNFCCASSATMPDAPKPKNSMRLALSKSATAFAMASWSSFFRVQSRLVMVWSKILVATVCGEAFFSNLGLRKWGAKGGFVEGGKLELGKSITTDGIANPQNRRFADAGTGAQIGQARLCYRGGVVQNGLRHVQTAALERWPDALYQCQDVFFCHGVALGSMG